jgi:ABC-type sugar transport system ATPase subunit
MRFTNGKGHVRRMRQLWVKHLLREQVVGTLVGTTSVLAMVKVHVQVVVVLRECMRDGGQARKATRTAVDSAVRASSMGFRLGAVVCLFGLVGLVRKILSEMILGGRMLRFRLIVGERITCVC